MLHSDLNQLSIKYLVPVAHAMYSSSVALIECFDPLRYLQILTVLPELLSSSKEIVFKQVLVVFLDTQKIFRRDSTDGSIRLVPYTVDLYEVADLFEWLEKNLTESMKETLFICVLPAVKERPLVNPEKTTNFLLFVHRYSHVIKMQKNFLVIVAPDRYAYFEPELLTMTTTIEAPMAIERERKSLIMNWIKTMKEAMQKIGAEVEALENIDIEYLKDITSGLWPYQLRRVFLNAIASMKTQKSLYDAILRERKNIFASAYGLELKMPEYDFSHVGGYAYLKEYFKRKTLRLKYRDLLKKFNVELPRGFVFIGPPGTGKTHFCKAIAGELGYPYIFIDFSMFGSKWLGETERNLRRLIRAIEAIAPVVVVFDELEGLAPQRTRASSHIVDIRVVSMLNTWLADEKRRSLIVATCNYPQQIEQALLRRGRFDAIIPVLYPDQEARKEIFRVHTMVKRKLPLADDVDFEELARRTEYYHGGDIAAVVQMAFDLALEDMETSGNIQICMNHFEESIRRVTIDRGERQKLTSEYVSIARKYSGDSEIVDLIAKKLGLGIKI
ncbi:MAG: ATP-binding protein [Candidatus Njordarchaeota archaeon]